MCILKLYKKEKYYETSSKNVRSHNIPSFPSDGYTFLCSVGGGIFDSGKNLKQEIDAETRNYTESWLDHASGSFSGEGTEEEPYLISSAADLAAISATVNEKRFEHYWEDTYFRQTADIDLSGYLWHPIGEWGYFFSANYDGCGYTISNMYCKDFVYGGLFGACYGSNLSNINVKSSIVENCAMAGGIVTYNSGWETVQNCTADTMIINARTAGGIICASSGCVIEGCVYTGTINSAAEGESLERVDYIGGILGSGGKCTVRNCYNYGAIIAENAISIGGIVGTAESDAVENCIQNGVIYIKSTKDNAFVGAFIGQSNIYDNGDVSSVRNSEGQGNIIIKSGALATSQNATFENCVFRGSHSYGAKYAFSSANSITSCYAICNGEKFYSRGGDFADFRIMPEINNGLPVPVSLYHIAAFGQSVPSSFWGEYNYL